MDGIKFFYGYIHVVLFLAMSQYLIGNQSCRMYMINMLQVSKQITQCKGSVLVCNKCLFIVMPIVHTYLLKIETGSKRHLLQRETQGLRFCPTYSDISKYYIRYSLDKIVITTKIQMQLGNVNKKNLIQNCCLLYHHSQLQLMT